MENKAISSHIVVVQPNQSVKPAENKANNTAENASSKDFANLLAAQIQGERPQQALAEANPAALEGADQLAQDTTLVLTQDHSGQSDNPIIPQINLLTLAQLNDAQNRRGEGKNEALAEDTDLSGSLKKVSKDAIRSDQAANESPLAAKFAASDKSLPLDFARELKTEASHTLNPSSLTQSNRAPAVPAASPIPTPNATVAVPVGNTGWDTAFSQRVVWVASNTQQIAHLQLNPPNLGPLEVRINLTSEHAHAAFTSPHASVRDAIEAALPRLREMLADNGLSLGNVNVSSESFQQQAQSGQNQQQRSDPFRELQRLATSTDASSLVSKGVAHIATGDRGLVDIFA